MNKYVYQLNNENNGITVVENIFINEFMPAARGEYVKVYLFGLKLTQNACRNAPDDEELAHLLNLSVTDVKDAWSYWERQGLVKQIPWGKGTQIVFRNICESRLQDEEPSFTLSKEIPEDYEDAFAKIEEMLGHEITPALYQSLKVWIGEYKFSPMLVTFLIEYSLNRIDKESSINSKVKYFQRVASNWHEEGIVNYHQAVASVDRFQRQNELIYKVLNDLGQTRKPMRSEYVLVEKWLDEFEFSDEMILEAVSRATVPSVKYVNAILKNWHKQGWRKVSDIVETPRKKRVEESYSPIIDDEEDLYADYR